MGYTLQRCIVAVPVGWLMNKTGDLGMRLVAPNKLYVHKTSSKPIVAPLFLQCSRKWSKTSSLLLPPVLLTLFAAYEIYRRGQRLQSTVKTPKFGTVNGQTVKNWRSRSWPRLQLWLQGIWEWPPLTLQKCPIPPKSHYTMGVNGQTEIVPMHPIR